MIKGYWLEDQRVLECFAVDRRRLDEAIDIVNQFRRWSEEPNEKKRVLDCVETLVHIRKQLEPAKKEKPS